MDRAIELDNSSAYAYRIRGRIKLKLAKKNNGICTPDVLADIETSVQLEQNSYNLFVLAEYYLYAGMPEKALASAQQSVALDDTNEYGYFYLSQAYKALGNDTEAAEHYDKAVALGYVPEAFD